MKFDLVFEEQTKSIYVHFNEVRIVDDGEYERGYADGYAAGLQQKIAEDTDADTKK